MMKSDPAPGTERRGLILNLALFCITGLALVIYTWVFATHIAAGLASSTIDELVWAATLCSSIFYATAVYRSYQTYVRRNGPSFSVGPFTILSTPLLPSSTTLAVNNTISLSSPIPSAYSPEMHNFSMMLQSPTRGSVDREFSVCPPTPDSVASNQTPRLVTPHMDRAYSYSSSSPSRSSPKNGKHRFGSLPRKNNDLDDVEKHPEIFGLGMGDIGDVEDGTQVIRA